MALGDAGGISVYSGQAPSPGGTVHVVIDVMGYFE
jgi:hypothetical protein